MPTTAQTTPPEPDGAPRLPVLDILRGVAILGILFMNISDFGGPIALLFGGDVRLLGWSPADRTAWWLREVLADGTARGLLEMLFGAGMVILTDRAATRASEWRLLRDYWVRNLVLFVFGLLHALLLLWPGDILHTYGVAALIAVLFRRLRPRLLLFVGLALAGLQLVGGATAYLAVAPAHGAPAPVMASREIIAENAARAGSAYQWAQSAWASFAFIVRTIEPFVVWEAAATMLIGAALYKLGVLQGARSRRFYQSLTAIAYAFGLACRIWAAWAETRFDGAPSLAYAFSEAARLATTLGHIGLINLLLLGPGRRVLAPFGTAGRTALSLYILQTLICGGLLYPPWGLALYGRQGWAALMATAFAVDAALLVLAVWWTRSFAIAPVEWTWRSLVAGRRLPFRRVDRNRPLRKKVGSEDARTTAEEGVLTQRRKRGML